MERDALLQHLELNDRHIAETRAAIARHETMMATLKRGGGGASELLGHMREVLAIHEAHRERILSAFKNSA